MPPRSPTTVGMAVETTVISIAAIERLSNSEMTVSGRLVFIVGVDALLTVKAQTIGSLTGIHCGVAIGAAGLALEHFAFAHGSSPSASTPGRPLGLFDSSLNRRFRQQAFSTMRVRSQRAQSGLYLMSWYSTPVSGFTFSSRAEPSHPWDPQAIRLWGSMTMTTCPSSCWSSR